MKKILCLAFVIFSAIGAFAQAERTIDKAEFDAVMIAGHGKYSGISFRRKTNTENFLPGAVKPGNTSKSILEITPARISRLLYEFDSPTLKQRKESITADGKRYMRDGDSPWTVEEMVSPVAKEPKESLFEIIEEKIEYRLLGVQTLDDKNATVYAKIENRRMIHKNTRSESLVSVTTKYWFGEDGGILKQEELMENRIKTVKNPTESLYRNSLTTVWEIDPNIKIEIPVIKQ